jgi:hypothetical protein
MGNTVYPVLAIGIDGPQQFFKVLFEGVANKLYYKEDFDVNRTLKALKNSSPVDVSSLPPSIEAIVAMWLNKDTWTGEDVWTKSEKLPVGEAREEYIPGKTDQMFIDVGAATGLSPERTKRALQKIITNDPVLLSLVRKGYEEAFGEFPPAEREQSLAQMLSDVPGANVIFKLTNPHAKLMQDVEDVRNKDTAIRVRRNLDLDYKIALYLNKDMTESEVNRYIIKQSVNKPDLRQSMLRDFKFQKATKDLPHAYWWKGTIRLPVEARAEAYINRFMDSSPEEILQLRHEEVKVRDAGGFFTPEFETALQLERLKRARENR